MSKIDRKGDGMMEALGISPDRCEELCNGIETEIRRDPERPLGEILDDAIKAHCKGENKENESRFMFYVFGSHYAAVRGLRVMSGSSLFDSLFREQKQEFSRS